MYHRALETRKAFGVALAGAVALAVASSASAQSDPVKCQQAISSAAAKFELARNAALAKCEDGVAKGKLPGTTVCGNPPANNGDQKTFDAIQKADQKRAAAIAKACGGGDKQFGGGDDIALSAIGWTGRVPACDLGERDGKRCQTSADCPSRCVGGLRNGLGVECPVNGALNSSCPSGCTGICAGGTKNGQPCFTNADCPGGTCGSKTCKGGTNNGNTCSTNADCPGNNPCQQSNGCGFGGKTVNECPDIEKEGCNNTLATLADIDTCVKCLGETGTDQIVDHFFDSLTPKSPSKALEKCKLAIGKSGAKYFAAHRAALAGCQKNALKNGTPNTCPDTKATDKITKARQKLLDAIAKACGGKDKVFGGTGANADLTPDAIGVPASCPNLDPPGATPSCYEFLATAQDVAECAACLVDYKARVLDAAVVTADDPTPAELNPLCGNAKIDAGETCDDGNTRDGDACPGNCVIADCPFSGTTATATVSLSAPVTDPVNALVVYVDYPETALQIPGIADQQAVYNRISLIPSNNASFTPNDLDYAVRIAVIDNDLPAQPFPPGGLLTIQFNRCGTSPLPALTEFRCRVEGASGATPPNPPQGVYTATCSVTNIVSP